MDIIGIGVAVLDVVMSVDTRPGMDDVVQAKDRRVNVGGGVVVALAIAATTGARTALVDAVGDDFVGDKIRDCLHRSGVSAELVQQHRDCSSSIASVWSLASDSSRSIVFSPGSNPLGQELQPRWTSDVADAVAGAKVLHLNGRHLDNTKKAIAIAKRCDTLISFDGGAGRFRSEIVELIEDVDILIVASEFAGRYFDFLHPKQEHPAKDQLAHWLQQTTRCRLAGVTLGIDGSHFASDDGHRWHEPAIRNTQTVDATGCGDAFRGGFLASIARGEDWRLASRCGSESAAEMAGILGSGLT